MAHLSDQIKSVPNPCLPCTCFILAKAWLNQRQSRSSEQAQTKWEQGCPSQSVFHRQLMGLPCATRCHQQQKLRVRWMAEDLRWMSTYFPWGRAFSQRQMLPPWDSVPCSPWFSVNWRVRKFGHPAILYYSLHPYHEGWKFTLKAQHDGFSGFYGMHAGPISRC